MTGVLVAEGMALVRDGLMGLLRSWPHGSVVSAGSFAEVRAGLPRLLGAEGRAVLLMDLALPGLDGMGGIRAVRDAFPAVRVVVLAVGEAPAEVLACLAAGAMGYVSKAAPFPELARAIETVCDGGVHVPGAAIGARPGAGTAVAAGGSTPGLTPGLTGRQRDVLRLLAEGRSTKDIARTLDLAVSTIKVHLAAVYRALGAHNRVEALRRAGCMGGFDAAFGRALS